jgi:hypothetical protein
MKIIRIASVIALGLMSTACASIIEGTTQKIALTTPPADGANCTLTNPEGSWTVTSPGTVKVHKSKRDLSVTCHKDGFQDGTATVQSHFNGATAGNILLGGVIGVGVDAATGANNNYPEKVEVPMAAAGAPAPTPASMPTTTPATPAPAKTSWLEHAGGATR